MRYNFILKCSTFVCLLVANYDIYKKLTYILSTSLLRKRKLQAKSDTLNTVLVLYGNILCTI